MGRHKHPHNTTPTTTTMQHRGYIVFLGLLSALSIDCSEKLDSANEKAASPLINCGCQCSSLTFRDANGVVQGNCLTVDSTGAQWCYVDQAYSSCQDLVPSKRFPNNPWSYEACATPATLSTPPTQSPSLSPTLWLPPLLDLWRLWDVPSRKYSELTEVTIRSPSGSQDRVMLPARLTCQD